LDVGVHKIVENRGTIGTVTGCLELVEFRRVVLGNSRNCCGMGTIGDLDRRRNCDINGQVAGGGSTGLRGIGGPQRESDICRAFGEIVWKETTWFGANNIGRDAEASKGGNNRSSDGNSVADAVGDDRLTGGAAEEVTAFAVNGATASGAGFGRDGIRDAREAETLGQGKPVRVGGHTH
jgi:hypothetical protein